MFRDEIENIFTSQGVSKILQERGCLVGGSVRDLILGRDVKDLDIILDGDPITVGKKIARKLSGSSILLHKETSTVRVVIPHGDSWFWIDMVPLTGPLEENLLSRDFTINSMAYPIHEGDWSMQHIIDPANGMADLMQKTIRQNSPQVFEEDPIRLFRAYRLAASLQFQIDPQTVSTIQHKADLIRNVSSERVRDEIFGILETGRASETIRKCAESGLLTAFFPELAALQGCTQNQNHHLDVWNHTLEAIHQVETTPFSRVSEDKIQPLLEKYLGECYSKPRTRKSLIKLALLFHDVTKPQVKTIEDGKVRFIGHDQSSAVAGGRAARKLRLSRKEELFVRGLIAYHLRPGFLTWQKPLTPRAIFRFFRDTQEMAPGILLLSYADRMSARGSATTVEDFEEHRLLVIRLLTEYYQQKEKPQTKLVSGKEVIDTLEITPGPIVSKILYKIAEAQAAGEISDHTEALHYLEALKQDIQDTNS